MADRVAAETFLARLRRDADTFRDFAQLDPKSARGTFYTRVVEALELGAFIPLASLADHRASWPPPRQADKALAAVESWAVRRTLLRRTMKDINKLVVALLKELDAASFWAGRRRYRRLPAEQTADARTWPSDEELLKELPDVKVYGNIKQQRLRAILAAVELQLRTEAPRGCDAPCKARDRARHAAGVAKLLGRTAPRRSRSRRRRDTL